MNEHLERVSADVQMIYSRIEDDTSRQIFENRLMMALTKNERKNDEIEFLRENGIRISGLYRYLMK